MTKEEFLSLASPSGNVAGYRFCLKSDAAVFSIKKVYTVIAYGDITSKEGCEFRVYYINDRGHTEVTAVEDICKESDWKTIRRANIVAELNREKKYLDDQYKEKLAELDKM